LENRDSEDELSDDMLGQTAATGQNCRPSKPR
jgi:hypothetical protein